MQSFTIKSPSNSSQFEINHMSKQFGPMIIQYDIKIRTPSSFKLKQYSMWQRATPRCMSTNQNSKQFQTKAVQYVAKGNSKVHVNLQSYKSKQFVCFVLGHSIV
ncbi:hypothetical protein DPMN_017260 [Dreissena polymorpha]|uniref:Uncharacterized protein n=1 Tax=Dreissena polymorpha TaxID=45954 RepID=A0A9D4S680_DREPO|nr:hypothetical protein DPMN_017260 [Dreissena polymorpha]